MFSVRVLVTGSQGQIGRAVLESVPDGVTAIGLSHRELDIADAAAVMDCVEKDRPEVIVNAAAYTAVDAAERESSAAASVNARGPACLAAAAAHCEARLLHLSTDFVFDGLSSSPYRPDSPTHPLSAYGATKREGEEAVLRALPHRSVVLRTAWVYARSGRNFVNTMLRLMAADGVVRVVS
ncbi:MAG: sugar nucleotide-binding protein, partial [Steroidobacteraceae bacterium]